MSKSILYNWQNFVDDQPVKLSNNNLMLLEMKKNVINFLSDEISNAESGENPEVMPFNDIFGEPTPDNPRTRMIMPYGNKDIQKMKILMLDIFDKLFVEYNKNPNIRYVESILWDNQKQTVSQKKKPQGWVEGDPIPTVDIIVGSPFVKVTYFSKLGDKDKSKRSIDISFGKLLQKYFPQEMEWWQGNKSKNISGKQSFFTSNTETMDQIVHEVRYGNETEIRNSSEQENIVIISRHPIDVVRMSDFELLSYSCHSQTGQYFECALQEAKRSALGGAVLFLVNKEAFDRKYPDGIMPQDGEIFNDYERSVTNKLSASPTSRLRLRRAIDQETSTEYAIPDKKMYGVNPEAFRKETFAYFANLQLNKFIDPKTKEIIIPKKLTRYGGSYEDSGEYTVGNNLVSLMQNAFGIAGISKEKLSQNNDWKQFSDEMNSYSITWSGSYAEEEENVSLVQNSACDEEKEEIEAKIEAFNQNQKHYIKFSIEESSCEDGESLFKIAARVQPIKLHRDLFLITDTDTIVDSLYNDAIFNDNYTRLDVNDGIMYPDLQFDTDSFTVTEEGDYFSFNFVYLNQTEIPADEVSSVIRDMKTFIDKVSYQDYVAEIRAILQDKDVGILERQNDADSFKDKLEELDHVIENVFTVQSGGPSKRVYTYTFNIRIFPTNSITKPCEEFLKQPEAIEPLFVQQFERIFNQKAKQDFLDSLRQIPLFKNMSPSDQKEVFQSLPQMYSILFGINKNKNRYDTPVLNYVPQMMLNVTILKTFSESELLPSVAFLKAVAKDPEIVEQAAYEAFNMVAKRCLVESKKHPSSKLIKEGWKKNR